MAERPILFSAPMIRALLAGTKTQTRRALRVQPPAGTFQVSTWHHPDPRPHFFAWQELPHETAMIADDYAYPCPYGAPGDHLWVREAFNDDRAEIVYRADGGLPGEWCDAGSRWRPSIHMPRTASRITLEVTEVRVERLQDISEADAVAEGGTEALAGWWTHEGLQWNDPGPCSKFGGTAIDSYRLLWEQINGPGSWDANPWVWCVSFRRLPC